MKVVLPLIHLDNLVFTPLPQLLLKQQLILDGVCGPDEATILEYSREDDLAATFNAIVACEPDIVGFSTYVWCFKAVEQISRALKNYYGDKVIVAWGGPHVSEKPELFAKRYKDSCDFVFGWYGELNFSEMCKRVKERGADTKYFGGLVGTGLPAYTAETIAIGTKAPEFDEMPLPYKKEWLPETVTDKIGDRVALLETYRNCPFSCLGRETLVKVQHYYKPGCWTEKHIPIVEVRETDKVWDGVEWVPTEGPIYRGLKSVGRWDGVLITEDHLVLDSGMWMPARYLDGWCNYGREAVVFDLLNCGPRNRFTIKTESGKDAVVHNCAYCLWGQAANKIEGRPYDLVVQDFEHLLGLGFKHYKFADAGLGLIRPRDKQLFKKFADMRLDKMGVHLRTYFFWMVIDEEWAEIFKELIGQGVIGQLDVGIQTFNAKALTDMHRPTDYKRFDRVMEILQRHKVPYSIDLIVGLPGDNLDGFKHSVKECIRYKPKRFQSFLCSVLPGTGYDLKREELGIKTIQGSLMDDDEKVIETATFPRKDIQTALDFEAWLYMVFSMQLCDVAIRKVAEDTGINELTVVENLRSWAVDKHLSEMVWKYRKNLYDSRQKGRVECDQYLFDHFADIYKELMEWAKLQGCDSEMRDCLLRFPKTESVARTLDGIDGIEYHGGVDPGGKHCGYSALRHGNDNMYYWRADPIPGVVGTKYAFWTWDKLDAP